MTLSLLDCPAQSAACTAYHSKMKSQVLKDRNLSLSVQVRALPKTYTINSVSIEDTINLLAALGQIRSLLSVRMGREEEKLMIRGLG